MYCPRCSHPNPADAEKCAQCGQDTRYVRERVFIGRQFVFAQANERHPIALKVDNAMQTYNAPVILSRHQHAVSFGDEPPSDKEERKIAPLPDQLQLPHPSLNLLTVMSDRKIYKPGDEACVFIVAPDAARSDASLEIKLAGQKVYEAQVALNQAGLALHRYPDLKEGEYSVQVTLPDRPKGSAECTFSVAEFTLSPLIATLEKHEYAEKHLRFTLKLLLLSVSYSGQADLGLQCQVCGERVVATQKVQAQDGLAQGDFDVSGHGGPFHVQVTTPDGNTALVSFPGTGAIEREHIPINPLGQTAEVGLLPWEDALPVRGFYIGGGEVNMTPLMLESVHAEKGKLQVAGSMSQAQVVTFNPRNGNVILSEAKDLKRGNVVEFDVDAPYTLFTVGAFTKDQPFEGWGIVIKPVAFEAQLTAPKTAKPGEEIDIRLEIKPSPSPNPLPLPKLGEEGSQGVGEGVFCLLLVYDARLEHESPVPKLAKRIYESVRDSTGNLAAGQAPNANDKQWALPGDMVLGAAWAGGPPPPMPVMPLAMAAIPADSALRSPRMMMRARSGASSIAETEAEVPVMVVAPTRMEFPELAYIELFEVEGQASRTVKLGDQIGTWRTRAYVFNDVDYRELTADVQAEKPLYAELDLPAIASVGDDISAAVNYNTREPAELIIATSAGVTRKRVTGSGTERFAINGPGRVEARIENQAESDWTVRDVLWPGKQQVTASRLMILDKGQTARGEKVVIYATMGQVLKDTITALIHYPFG